MTEKESQITAKCVKMLAHYLHHFGEIRNVIFRVEQTRSADPPEWGVDISISPAALHFPRMNFKEPPKPKAHDVAKMCTFLELCPDLVVVDKRTTEQIVRYTVQSVNFDLNFIRTEFFKK